MISTKDLMRLHVEALFTHDDAGRLLAVNERGGAAAPRFFLGRTAAGNVWRFRCDVDPALANDLHALCLTQPKRLVIEDDPTGAAVFIDRIAHDDPVRRTWAGPAFCLPPDRCDIGSAVRVTPENATLLTPYLDAWRADVAADVPMAVVLEGAAAVSVCCSVRMSARAHEAGVETHPNFRRCGHAARAVAAWARIVCEMDRVPLYSTSWENQPSRALAQKLGLIQFGADLHIT